MQGIFDFGQFLLAYACNLLIYKQVFMKKAVQK